MRLSINRCGYLLIDGSASICRCDYLLIDASASIYRCGHLFIDAAIYKIDFLKLNLLSNGLIEKFWETLWLGIGPFLCFKRRVRVFVFHRGVFHLFYHGCLRSCCPRSRSCVPLCLGLARAALRVPSMGWTDSANYAL